MSILSFFGNPPKFVIFKTTHLRGNDLKKLIENTSQPHGKSIYFPVEKIRFKAKTDEKYLNSKNELKSALRALNQKL